LRHKLNARNENLAKIQKYQSVFIIASKQTICKNLFLTLQIQGYYPAKNFTMLFPKFFMPVQGFATFPNTGQKQTLQGLAGHTNFQPIIPFLLLFMMLLKLGN